jgi:hypothetical protein
MPRLSPPAVAPTKTSATQLTPTTPPPASRLPTPHLATRRYPLTTSKPAPSHSPLPALKSPPRCYYYKIGGQSFRLVSYESRSKLAPRRYHYPILKNCNRSNLGSSDSRSQPAHRRYNYSSPRNINCGGAAENHPALNTISTSAPWPVAEEPSG